MPNNCLSVLYKHIIQVENKNVGLKVCVGGGGGTNIPLPPNQKSGGGTCPPPPPPLPTPVIYILYRISVLTVVSQFLMTHRTDVKSLYRLSTPLMIRPTGVITPNQIPLTTIVTYLQKGYRSRISNHWATIAACSVVPPIYKKSKKTYCHVSF